MGIIMKYLVLLLLLIPCFASAQNWYPVDDTIPTNTSNNGNVTVSATTTFSSGFWTPHNDIPVDFELKQFTIYGTSGTYDIYFYNASSSLYDSVNVQVGNNNPLGSIRGVAVLDTPPTYQDVVNNGLIVVIDPVGTETLYCTVSAISNVISTGIVTTSCSHDIAMTMVFIPPTPTGDGGDTIILTGNNAILEVVCENNASGTVCIPTYGTSTPVYEVTDPNRDQFNLVLLWLLVALFTFTMLNSLMPKPNIK